MSKRPRIFITPEYRAKVLTALHKRHGGHLAPGESFGNLEGEAHEDAWTLQISFHNRDRSLFLPVEVAMVVAENPQLKHAEARDVLVDFVDYFFGEYFRDAREVTLPLDWKPFTFGEFTIRARGWERNQRLEEAADRLLAGEPVDDLL